MEIPDPELTADEKAAREQFAKDWPDHASVLEKREEFFKQQMEARFTRAIGAVAQKIYEDFAPFAKVAADTSRKTFREYVIEKHSDFDAVKPRLEGWIKEQPAYLRDAYMRAYTDGTAEDVADLTQRFKDATGVKPQAPNTPAQPTPQASNDGKADALAPVTARRTKPEPSGPDMSDFDTAFDEAAQAAPK